MIENETTELVLSISDKVTIGIITAVTSATLAFFFNWMHWKRDKSLEAFRVLSKDFVKTLEELEEHVIAYWSKDHSPECKHDEICLEAKIKIKTASLNKLLDLIFEIKKIEKKGNQYSNLKKILNDIFEASTGDSFESANRKRSKSVISKVTRHSSNLRIGILKFTYSI